MRTCPRRLSRASFGGITRTRQLILMPTDTDLKTIQEKISEVFGPLGCAWASYKLYMAPNSGVGAPNPTAMHNQLHKIILLAHALHCIPETYMFLAPCGWSRVPKNFSKERRRRLQRYSRRMNLGISFPWSLTTQTGKDLEIEHRGLYEDKEGEERSSE